MDQGEEVRFLLRLPPKLHAALQDLAAQERRSLHGEIVFLLDLVASERGAPMIEYKVRSALEAKGYEVLDFQRVPVHQAPVGSYYKVDIVGGVLGRPRTFTDEPAAIMAWITQLPSIEETAAFQAWLAANPEKGGVQAAVEYTNEVDCSAEQRAALRSRLLRIWLAHDFSRGGTARVRQSSDI